MELLFQIVPSYLASSTIWSRFFSRIILRVSLSPVLFSVRSITRFFAMVRSRYDRAHSVFVRNARPFRDHELCRGRNNGHIQNFQHYFRSFIPIYRSFVLNSEKVDKQFDDFTFLLTMNNDRHFRLSLYIHCRHVSPSAHGLCENHRIWKKHCIE